MDSFLISPNIVPPLDPAFRPAALATRAFAKAVRNANPVPVQLALEQGDGSVTHFKTEVFPASHKEAAANFTPRAGTTLPFNDTAPANDPYTLLLVAIQ